MKETPSQYRTEQRLQETRQKKKIGLRWRFFVGDAEFEPGTSASEVWCTINEPPHLRPRLVTTHTGYNTVEL